MWKRQFYKISVIFHAFFYTFIHLDNNKVNNNGQNETIMHQNQKRNPSKETFFHIISFFLVYAITYNVNSIIQMTEVQLFIADLLYMYQMKK